MLTMPRAIKDFFERFVYKAFHSHKKTAGWQEEVLSRPHDWSHRTNTILERGLADFDVPYKNLTADEKVTIYCYQYMQKHAASTYFVLDAASEAGLAEPEKSVLVDFGCGPATLAVALAWLGAVRDLPRPQLSYVGVERCKSMRARGRDVTTESKLFHADSTFRFRKSLDDAKELFSEIDGVAEDHSPLVLNFSYFFSSKFLNVADVVNLVGRLRDRYESHSIWLVYQNPAHSDFRSPWERFKRASRGFKSIQSLSKRVVYPNTTNKSGELDAFNVDYELMLHRPS